MRTTDYHNTFPEIQTTQIVEIFQKCGHGIIFFSLKQHQTTEQETDRRKKLTLTTPAPLSCTLGMLRRWLLRVGFKGAGAVAVAQHSEAELCATKTEKTRPTT